MTEEIIIDGVDVAGCRELQKDCQGEYVCLDRNRKSLYCNNQEYCYYKQLKRLEQENFALTQESQQKSQTICELEQENRALKELNKKICEDCSKEIKVYWNALEEIKHGIMHIPPFDKQSAQMVEALLKLINEVLG